MERFNRVYPQLLKHYRVADNVEEVFETLGIYVNQTSGRVVRKQVRMEEEEPAM
jgi:hypothetical protein